MELGLGFGSVSLFFFKTREKRNNSDVLRLSPRLYHLWGVGLIERVFCHVFGCNMIWYISYQQLHVELVVWLFQFVYGLLLSYPTLCVLSREDMPNRFLTIDM